MNFLFFDFFETGFPDVAHTGFELVIFQSAVCHHPSFEHILISVDL
jgi:hypothetical protein